MVHLFMMGLHLLALIFAFPLLLITIPLHIVVSVMQGNRAEIKKLRKQVAGEKVEESSWLSDARVGGVVLIVVLVVLWIAERFQ